MITSTPTETWSRWLVKYRRSTGSLSRVYRITVTARSTDEARLVAAKSDPLFLATTETPRRRARLLVEPLKGAHL